MSLTANANPARASRAARAPSSSEARLLAAERGSRPRLAPIAREHDRHAHAAAQLRDTVDDAARHRAVEAPHGGHRGDRRDREQEPEDPGEKARERAAVVGGADAEDLGDRRGAAREQVDRSSRRAGRTTLRTTGSRARRYRRRTDSVASVSVPSWRPRCLLETGSFASPPRDGFAFGTRASLRARRARHNRVLTEDGSA